MNRIITINQSQTGHIHIDRITVCGPLDHIPKGELFYKAYDDFNGLTPVGASAFKPKGKRNSNDVYVRSKDVQSNGRAYRFEIDCCPPKQLQKHNFFGHADLLDYTYAMFDMETRKHAILVDPVDREQWRTGRVDLTETHLTGNFWCPPSAKSAIFNAIDISNPAGKHRDIPSCIGLGFTGKRRSVYHGLTIYDKWLLLVSEWTRAGKYQRELIALAEQSLRFEAKLFSQGLKKRKLGSVKDWLDVDMDALFFEILSNYNVRNAIQPLLTEAQEATLTKAERRVYLLWLGGEDLKDHFSRTTVWKYERNIDFKTGIDMRSSRRPEALPPIDLAKMLTSENLVPLPAWAVGSPHYWAPGTAFRND